jgi:hypothetical protein
LHADMVRKAKDKKVALKNKAIIKMALDLIVFT